MSCTNMPYLHKAFAGRCPHTKWENSRNCTFNANTFCSMDGACSWPVTSQLSPSDLALWPIMTFCDLWQPQLTVPIADSPLGWIYWGAPCGQVARCGVDGSWSDQSEAIEWDHSLTSENCGEPLRTSKKPSGAPGRPEGTPGKHREPLRTSRDEN